LPCGSCQFSLFFCHPFEIMPAFERVGIDRYPALPMPLRVISIA